MEHIETITKNNTQSTIIHGGDFNARDIDWQTHQVTLNSTKAPNRWAKFKAHKRDTLKQ